MGVLLRVFGVVCIAVGALHIALGLQADQMLGAGLSGEALANASLDSQNRFYGAQFVLVGAVAWMCGGDLERHAKLFRVLMAVFFLGGLARLVSLLLLGWPAPMVQLLAVSELVIPPLLLLWHARLTRARKPASRSSEH